MAKILFIGDVVGKSGRKILGQVLPQWKDNYQPDVTIVNVENLAHGKGVTLSTLQEIDRLGIDCFTSGNHIFNKDSTECFEYYSKLIRPANYMSVVVDGEGLPVPGHGFYRFAKNGQQYLVINLNGQVFMEHQYRGTIANPFLQVEEILQQESQKGDIIIVDFHAEATSEKKTMGFYLDGRADMLFGTHTHVPTADAHIMTKGLGYITDVGMTGTRDSALGVKFQNALDKFLNPSIRFKNEMEETGVLQINGVLVETGKDQCAVKIIKLYQET